MNVGMKRAMNSETLGARIIRNRALDQKIWAFEVFRGKTVFLGGSGVILEFLERLEGLDTKDRGSCKICGFFRDFCGISERLKWFKSYL
jgi:hypothetical protein